jgi:hypothetical protein
MTCARWTSADTRRSEVRLEETLSLKPPDAIHLATAMQHGVEEFQTYDKKLLNLSITLPFAIAEPWTATPRLPGVG